MWTAVGGMWVALGVGFRVGCMGFRANITYEILYISPEFLPYPHTQTRLMWYKHTGINVGHPEFGRGSMGDTSTHMSFASAKKEMFLLCFSHILFR